MHLEDLDAVILCGGRGKRLGKITDRIPKPMVLINQKPFMDYLLDYLKYFGLKRFILCTGYKSKFIENYYKNKKEYNFIFSRENKPLGTGGAIKNARKFIKSKNFFVFNGDSFLSINLSKFLDFHLKKKAVVSIALVNYHKELDTFGIVELDRSKRIKNFLEKQKRSSMRGFINGGVYLFNRKIFSLMPKKYVFSLEMDLFPHLVSRKVIYGFETKGKFIDIGTPLRYKGAVIFFKNFKWRG